MPTPFEQTRSTERGTQNSDWPARAGKPKRSVFGNYSTARKEAVEEANASFPLTPGERESAHSTSRQTERATLADSRTTILPPPEGEGRGEGEQVKPTGGTLQSSIDTAVARTFLYRFLARIFEDPEPEGWDWLCHEETQRSLQAALGAAGISHFAKCETPLTSWFNLSAAADFAAAHLTCFGHTVRGDCPMNEIEYGDIKADPLFQPHRLSDLGAFFAAFGLELTPDAAERIDHISIELEFMSVLAAKEAHAIEHQFDDDNIGLVRDAQKKFLREHLGRWSPAFVRRLARMADGTVLGAVAQVLGEFIKLECARLNVPPGSEDLLLRPVDDAAERLCDSCGIHNLPPGAATTGARL